MNPQLKALFEQAIHAFQSGNFDTADLILKKVLQKDINSADAVLELGIAYAKANRFIEASAIFCCLQPYRNNDVRIPYNLGLIHSLQGKHLLALKAYDAALKIQPNDVEVLINKGSTCNDIKDYVLALEVLERAIHIRSNIPEAWSNKGVSLNNLKLYNESINAFNEAIKLAPNYYQAWSNKSVPLNKIKRHKEALSACDKAIHLKPDYVEAWYNKANTLYELKRYDDALANFEKTIHLKPDYVEAWYNKANTLYELKRYDEALANFEKTIHLKPDYVGAFSNKGNSLYQLNQFYEAITQYDKALSLKPDYAETWCNKGVTLNELNQFYEAITHYDKALSLKPDYAEAWYNKGVTLNELNQFYEAITHYDKALSLKPDIEWLSGDLIHTKMTICDWSDLSISLDELCKKIMAGQKAIQPFKLLALNEDSVLHKKSTEIYVADKYRSLSSLNPFRKNYDNKKIRIGYFSADFRNHPVSFLTAELYELHDKNKFEIIAFSFGIDDKSLLRFRLSKAFSQFIDVRNMSDFEIAKLSRNLQIDIAVDLGGHTKHNRLGIFCHRAAPIQIHWLGYPGTIGADFIDYIVADRMIIPDSHQHFYSEKIVYLPDTYMVDDSTRVASSRVFTREEYGLPQNSFVFSCLNNSYKFNPQVLDSWTSILNEVEDSVLWVSENNEFFKNNLTKELEIRGLERNRVIFAKREKCMGDHLARFKLADLFLDTWPYNAHSTAVDSLKSGVPVLTLLGQSFASRVGSSLLNAIGMPELITLTQESYEDLAINLATHQHKLTTIKRKLARNKQTNPLFNSSVFAKNLEAAYIEMQRRYHAGLKPEHITIS